MTDMEKKIMLRLCAKVIKYVDFETDPENSSPGFFFEEPAFHAAEDDPLSRRPCLRPDRPRKGVL